MNLPHTYKGFKIKASSSNRTTTWWLQTWSPEPDSRMVKRYRPPMQTIYRATNGHVAYDHDIKDVEKRIDQILRKKEAAS
jgi:hypothetical protein